MASGLGSPLEFLTKSTRATKREDETVQCKRMLIMPIGMEYLNGSCSQNVRRWLEPRTG
jgi:hypothetical protein